MPELVAKITATDANKQLANLKKSEWKCILSNGEGIPLYTKQFVLPALAYLTLTSHDK